MNKKIVNIILALAIVAAGFMGVTNKALAFTQTKGWTVTYNDEGLTSDYDVDKATITSVMPGDTIVYEVDYKNDTKNDTDFYINTKVINSLEESLTEDDTTAAKGGAYSYKLSYELNGATTVIYDSETIGGDNETVVGLKQIQSELEDNQGAYFSVGRLSNNQAGKVKLEISLDGNSQDNGYMAKLATLDLAFGVKEAPKPTTQVVKNTSVNKVVYVKDGKTEVVLIDDPVVPLAGNPVTGDSILPIIICSISMALGLLLVVWYFAIMKKGR